MCSLSNMDTKLLFCRTNRPTDRKSFLCDTGNKMTSSKIDFTVHIQKCVWCPLIAFMFSVYSSTGEEVGQMSGPRLSWEDQLQRLLSRCPHHERLDWAQMWHLREYTFCDSVFMCVCMIVCVLLWRVFAHTYHHYHQVISETNHKWGI